MVGILGMPSNMPGSFRGTTNCSLNCCALALGEEVMITRVHLVINGVHKLSLQYVTNHGQEDLTSWA